MRSSLPFLPFALPDIGDDEIAEVVVLGSIGGNRGAPVQLINGLAHTIEETTSLPAANPL
jgi:hypothetical protein